MEESLSDRYVSFENRSKQRNTSQKFFDWILNYPLFNEIRNSSLSNRFSSLCLNDGEHFYEKKIQRNVKRKSARKDPSVALINEPNELTTNLIKNRINKNDYNLINNNKFYLNIIRKSEQMRSSYNDGIREERRKKLIFERVKEKYLKKKEVNRESLYVLVPSNPTENKKKNVIVKEECNPFFNFFEKDINKNVYHSSINFSLKMNIQLNRYFYRVISNQLGYYGIKKDIYVNILNVLSEISKYYHSYGYDVLNNIKVKYFPYRSITNSFYIHGLVFTNCSVYFDDVEIKNPKILLLDAEKRGEYEILENRYDDNYSYTYFISKKLSSKNLNIILIYGEVPFYIKKLLMKKNIYFFTSIKKKNIYRLSNILRTKILCFENFKSFDNSYIARANYFKIQKYKKNVKNIYLCCNNKFLTICLFGNKELRDSSLEKENCNFYCDSDNKMGRKEEDRRKMEKSNLTGENNVIYEDKSINIFESNFKKEIEKENILENFLQVYYKNKSDDYMVDYYFLNKEKKINFSEKKKKNENKKIERMKILHSLIKPNKIIKDQICNNYEHCFYNSAKNKIIDVVNYFLFNNFMKNYECSYEYIYYYLNVINSSYLHHTPKNVITNEEDFLTNSYLLRKNLLENNKIGKETEMNIGIEVEKKINKKAEQIIAKNILFYCYHLETAKNLEMITYFICPSYMFINNIYNNISMYLFDNKNHDSKWLFYNFFFNYKYIFDISLQQFVCLIHTLSFNLTCPFELCGNYLCYHQICIQMFLKRVLIIIKKEKSDDVVDDIVMNIVCNKCDVVQEKIINISISFSEFLLCIIHSENYVNMQCSHSGKNNSYELSFKNLKICFYLHDNDIYKSISKRKSWEDVSYDGNHILCMQNGDISGRSRDTSEEIRHHNCKCTIKSKRKIIIYVKKNIRNIIYNNVFYYYPCRCITGKNGYKYEKREGRKNNTYKIFNIYNIIETFPFVTSSMLPMYCSLKYLVYNCVIQHYRYKNRHLYMKKNNEKRKKEKYNNPNSPLYFKNKCKKCKYIKISNFLSLEFFNVLFIVKRIFFNLYLLINFLITLLKKNMFIKVNEIMYCISNTSYFIEDNFSLVKKDTKMEIQNGNINRECSNGRYEIIFQGENSLIGAMEDKDKGIRSKGSSVNHQNVHLSVTHRSVDERNNTNNEIGAAASASATNATNAANVDNCYSPRSNNVYILNDINKIRNNLVKQFLLFRKFKKKMEHYKKYLIEMLRNFYFYAVVYLTKRKSSLDVEIFFSFYITKLERINLKIQADIQRMERLKGKKQSQYLRFVRSDIEQRHRAHRVCRLCRLCRLCRVDYRRRKLPPPVVHVNGRVENGKREIHPNGSSDQTFLNGITEVKNELPTKWRSSKMKGLLVKKKKGRKFYNNLMCLKNVDEAKVELNNSFYFVREYDVHKLYMKELYYIYNIENYRKKKYMYDIKKEEYENSSKKLFYSHISKIVDSVRNSEQGKNKIKTMECKKEENRESKGEDIGEDKREDKREDKKENKKNKNNLAFLFNQNDTSNLIFHALISSEYKEKLKQIYQKEKEKIRHIREEETYRRCKIEKKEKSHDDRIRKRQTHNKNETHYRNIKKYLKENVGNLSNHFLNSGMVSDFLNSNNNDTVMIPLNENASVYIYFPLQFYYLRTFLCNKETIFLRSLIKSNYINFEHRKRHFVKTYDDKYIIKEINRHEFKSFINRYKDFFQYFSNIFFKGKKSLLCFLYGLYQIEIKKKNKKTIKTYIILENVKIENRNSKILIFDIKGARKKKNLQKLLKQNKKSFSLFEKNDTFSLNTCNLTEKVENDVSDDNTSDISINLDHFSRYLRREKKINFKCVPGKGEKRKNKPRNKNGHLTFLLSGKGDPSRGQQQEEDSIMRGNVTHRNIEGEDRRAREAGLFVRRVKRMEGNKECRKGKMYGKNYSNAEQTEEKKKNMKSCSRRCIGDGNKEGVHRLYEGVKRKMMLESIHYGMNSFWGNIREKRLRRHLLMDLRSNGGRSMDTLKRGEGKIITHVENKKYEKNSNIFINEIILNIRRYLLFNRKVVKLKKREQLRKKMYKKKVRHTYLHSVKASANFLTKKKEYILNRDNLTKYKMKYTNGQEEKNDFLNKESYDSKNLDSLNSAEKYNNFAINNYNALKSYIVLFDDNFKDFIKSKVINLTFSDYEDLMDSLKEDTNFLSSQDIMDYSLLIHMDISNHQIIFKIIDYLRPYTWDKSVENFSKSVLYLTKGYRPTIIHSEYYKKRFLSNIKKYIFYYIPIYALKKENVFNISKEETFSVVNLHKNHPYRTYFFYSLFNLIIRYYNNFYIYMKYFNIKERPLYSNVFAKNLYSKKNVCIFLSYYLKELYLRNGKDVEEGFCKNRDIFLLKNGDSPYCQGGSLCQSHFLLFPREAYSSMRNAGLVHSSNLNREVLELINDNVIMNSSSTCLNKEQPFNMTCAGDKYLNNPIFPFYTQEQYSLLSSSKPGSDIVNDGNNDYGPYAYGTYQSFHKDIPHFSKSIETLSGKSYTSDVSKIKTNFFQKNYSFDEKEFKIMKKIFYKRISEFQVKILRKLQKNNYNVERVSSYVQNNIYIEMNDVNMHYTNINYLDAFNIYNICEKNFNEKRRKRRHGKRDSILLYIPSYFLFVLDKK
ncbi:hypothetical protein, conserved [Plasmodium ovale wallikeri]|uniref:PIPK domain-containing protein n=1 Tax=Plasmodium ovale wallikeri TaxID=864142 RepID=A0A1A8ZPL6_PLAOA|nr:hypothetical protein, conserved [Plasmodium ovale wallikeri]SBT46600.1 hypothetical protein, conserved [Plasmodium ovale wallikeri]